MATRFYRLNVCLGTFGRSAVWRRESYPSVRMGLVS